MCKSICYTYACSHKTYFNQSICHGTYTYIPYKRNSIREPRLSCEGWPLITLGSEQQCGPCSRLAAQKELDDEVTRLMSMHGSDNWGVEEHEQVTRAREKRDHESYSIEKRYPGESFEKPARPEKGGKVTCRTISTRRKQSLLRNEVLPEDVVLPQQHAKGAICSWEDDWGVTGEDYIRLEDEVAENQAAQEASGIIVSWSPWVGQESVDQELYRHWDAESWVENKAPDHHAPSQPTDASDTSTNSSEECKTSGHSSVHAKENKDPTSRRENTPKSERRDSKVAHVQDLTDRASCLSIQYHGQG